MTAHILITRTSDSLECMGHESEMGVGVRKRTGLEGAVPSSTVRYQGVKSMAPISQLIFDQMICTREM